MDKIKAIVSQHKKASLLALFALIVFVGFSVTSAMNVAQRRAEGESIGQVEPSNDKSPSSESSKDIRLSDSQKEAIKGYDDKVKRLIETMSSSIWSDKSGTNTLRFYDTYYVETINGDEKTHPYAITKVEYGTNGADAEIDTVVFLTDTGTHIATYTIALDVEDGSISTSTISSSSMFSKKDGLYECADPVKSITVKGMNSEMTGLFGGDASKLTKDLSSWCACHFPTASEAVWQKSAIIDYEKGIISTNFTLNTETPVSIAVTYSLSDKSFNFEL